MMISLVRGETSAFQSVGVDPPPRAVVDERPFADRRAERPREAPHLHVVRHHHHDLVARLDEIPGRDEVGFRAAVGDQDMIRRSRRDTSTAICRAQRRRAVGLRVAQLLGEQRVARRRVVDQLAEAQRMHAALGQVELHLVFIGGLHPLHGKRLESHGGDFTSFCASIGVRHWTILTFPDTFGNRSMAAQWPRAKMNSPTAPNLARIPAGDFLMGAADAEEDERPVHRVYRQRVLHRTLCRHARRVRAIRPRHRPSAARHPRICR